MVFIIYFIELLAISFELYHLTDEISFTFSIDIVYCIRKAKFYIKQKSFLFLFFFYFNTIVDFFGTSKLNTWV